MKEFYLPNKRIRAEVIKRYYGNQRLYCFSCGNSTRELERAGCNIISITDTTPIIANGWVDSVVSDRYFNGVNVTSGYLPVHLIREIGKQFVEHIGPTDDLERIVVPVGSGETLLALSFFIPLNKMIGVWSSECPPIQRDVRAPLLGFLNNVALFKANGRSVNDSLDECIASISGIDGVIYTE